MIHFAGHNVTVDTDGFRYGQTVFVSAGWEGAGAQGIALGNSVMVDGQSWTPVLWKIGDPLETEDFDFHKTASLEAG